LEAAAVADHPQERYLSLLGVSVTNLVDETALQLELPLPLLVEGRRPGRQLGAARWGVDRSVDAIRAKFGRDAVGYATVVLSGASRVPEEFRELAERPTGRQD
jgi:DNA polymerase-4